MCILWRWRLTMLGILLVIFQISANWWHTFLVNYLGPCPFKKQQLGYKNCGRGSNRSHCIERTQLGTCWSCCQMYVDHFQYSVQKSTLYSRLLGYRYCLILFIDKVLYSANNQKLGHKLLCCVGQLTEWSSYRSVTSSVHLNKWWKMKWKIESVVTV